MSLGIRRERQRILRFGPKPRCLLSFLAKLPVRQLWARPAVMPGSGGIGPPLLCYRVRVTLGPPRCVTGFGLNWARPAMLPGDIGPAPLCYWVRAALGPPCRVTRFGWRRARPAVVPEL